MIADPQWLEESWNLITRFHQDWKSVCWDYRDNEILPEEKLRHSKNFSPAKASKYQAVLWRLSPASGDRLTGSATPIPSTGKVPKNRNLHCFPFRWNYIRRPVHFQLPMRFMPKGKRKLNLGRISPECYEGGWWEPCRQECPECQSENPSYFKPPNWYEQYQFSGYNLESQPKVLMKSGPALNKGSGKYRSVPQQYQSYGIMRYFEHIKPGKFGGGWVDVGARQTLNRYNRTAWEYFVRQPKAIIHWSYGSLVETINSPDGKQKCSALLLRSPLYIR